MSILVRYRPVGLTAEQYDGSTRALEEGGLQFPPDGMDLHVCFGDPNALRVQ